MIDLGDRVVRLVGVPGLLALAAFGVSAAAAADLPAALPVKAPTAPPFDWNGFYVGGHFGYATGSSGWTATQAGGPPLAGSLDLYNSFNAFNGNGSYFAGLQAGYNVVLPSGFLFGVESDVSAPGCVAVQLDVPVA